MRPSARTRRKRWLSIWPLCRLGARRYGVKAPRVPWVAAQETPRAQTESADHPEALDRQQCIGRAARMEATVPAQEWADKVTVTAYQRGQQPLHLVMILIQWRSSDARSTAPGAPAAAGWPTTTRSSPASRRCARRTDSRTWRLIRLRATALRDTRRDTTKPTRRCVRPLPTAATLKYRSRAPCPAPSTRANARASKRR